MSVNDDDGTRENLFPAGPEVKCHFGVPAYQVKCQFGMQSAVSKSSVTVEMLEWHVEWWIVKCVLWLGGVYANIKLKSTECFYLLSNNQ